MRLGQLSRKINTRPVDIVEFLSTQGVTVQDNPNSRVNDADVKLVLAKFAPQLALDDVIAEEVVENQPVDSGSGEIPPQESISSAESLSEPEPEVSNAGGSEDAESNGENEGSGIPEVIKAPKIELQGLRVLGKIDLPQPKKKETSETPVPQSEDIQKSPRRERRPAREDQRNGERQRRGKNPVAMQREREAKEAAERKREAIQKEKDKRTQYYLNRVKPSSPVRKASIVDEPLSQLQDEAPDQPRTLWGKFVKWLTSY